MSGLNINPSQYAQSFAGGGGCNIPIGETMAQAVSHEYKGTKTSGGGYLAITMQDEVTGRQGIWRFNFWNQNAETVRIAHEQFSAYLAMAGWNMQSEFTDATWLHGKRVPILVGEQTNDPQKRPEIKGVLNRQPNMSSQQTSGMQAPQGFGGQQGGPQGGMQAPNPGTFGGPQGGPQGGGFQPPQGNPQGGQGGGWPQGNQGNPQQQANQGGQQPQGGNGWPQQQGNGGGFQPPQGQQGGQGGGFQPPQGNPNPGQGGGFTPPNGGQGGPQGGGFQPPQGGNPQQGNPQGGGQQWNPQQGNPNGGGQPNW